MVTWSWTDAPSHSPLKPTANQPRLILISIFSMALVSQILIWGFSINFHVRKVSVSGQEYVWTDAKTL